MNGDTEAVRDASGWMNGDTEAVRDASGWMNGDTEVLRDASGWMNGDTEVLRDARGWMNGDTEAGSSNIPGLQTRYELHRIELPLKETSVPQLGLPDGDPFATVEETSPRSPSGSRQLHL